MMIRGMHCRQLRSPSSVSTLPLPLVHHKRHSIPPTKATPPSENRFPTITQNPFRLFSNLDDNLSHQPGNVLQAATLVAGTAVGAGILALPAVCSPSGFIPSATAITAAAGYSVFTGLLVAEVCINTMCELGSARGVSLGSMARRTLGESGALTVSATYALLHYSLLVAYIAKAGETLHTALPAIPLLVADVGFAGSLGLLCYLGEATPKILDNANSLLVVLVIASFLGLLAVVAPGVDISSLSNSSNWENVPPALPVIALAFVFQNVVPVIASSLEGDIRKIRIAIISGIAVPLIMFLLWDAAILGNVGATSLDGTLIEDPLTLLRTSGPLTSILVDAFSLLAVATSFIGFVLGLTEFVAEALDINSTVSSNNASIHNSKAIPYVLTLVPPLGCALIYPDLFFKALDFAGTYGVLVLFGLIPVAMVWNERYVEGKTLTSLRVAPQGKGWLLLSGAAAVGIIINQFIATVGTIHQN